MVLPDPCLLLRLAPAERAPCLPTREGSRYVTQKPAARIIRATGFRNTPVGPMLRRAARLEVVVEGGGAPAQPSASAARRVARPRRTQLAPSQGRFARDSPRAQNEPSPHASARPARAAVAPTPLPGPPQPRSITATTNALSMPALHLFPRAHPGTPLACPLSFLSLPPIPSSPVFRSLPDPPPLAATSLSPSLPDYAADHNRSHRVGVWSAASKGLKPHGKARWLRTADSQFCSQSWPQTGGCGCGSN